MSSEAKRKVALYLETLYNLIIKDLKIKYKSSILGYFWSLINPLMMVIVLTFVFTVVINIKNIGGIENFALFMLCGIIPWTYLSAALYQSVVSITSNTSFVKNIPFSPIVFPVSISITNFLTMILTTIIFALVLAVLSLFGTIQLYPGVYVIWLPPLFLIMLVFVTGFSLFFSALNVLYRDAEHLLHTILMIWFYLTPVFYTREMLPPLFRALYYMNPMAFIVESYRSVMLYGISPQPWALLGNMFFALLVLCAGFLFFHGRSWRFIELL